MFHTGVVLPDPTRELERGPGTPPAARFLDEADLVAKTEAFLGLITAWIAMRSMTFGLPAPPISPSCDLQWTTR